jgi:UDP-N-acetylmuramoyl-L-alanyl-D-glutamate--2,6-diaminopimelate ligase
VSEPVRSLRQLFPELAFTPAQEHLLSGMTLDSRAVKPGDLFLAVAGVKGHGVAFVEDAILHGAAAVAVETDGLARVEAVQLPGRSVPVAAVPDLGRRAGELASRFFGEPSAQLRVVGVTGTNGKTSITQFIARAMGEEAPAGIIGTLGSGLVGTLKTTGHTTPDAVNVHATLAEFLAAGARSVAMEVSSHGLHQGRVNGVRFEVGVFTNLTHEHLDYHGTLEAYAEAKRRLFDFPGMRVGVINADDPVGRRWLSELPPTVEPMGYGLDPAQEPHLQGHQLDLTPEGLAFAVHAAQGEARIQSPLLGRFNASNLLAALGALLALGMPLEVAAARLSRLRAVPGRMERFGGGRGRPTALVDYAHTPDALEQVLHAARAHTRGRLWCVFGCGGNRDRSKRPVMGGVAERLADRIVITNDNPRHEDPDLIIQEIQRGMKQPMSAQVIPDRAEAIAFALNEAAEGDVVVVAGKGHETEQQIGDRRSHFSDREQVAAFFGEEVPRE